MMIHEITEKVGRHKQRKRIGRGVGSGYGKTAGRGHKGYGARAGNSNPHEGGAIPMWKRFPKRGFSNAEFMTHYAVVNIKAIEARFQDGEEVNAESLAKLGLIRDTKLPVKVLGEGELTKKVTVTADKFSKSASEKITAAGGSVTVIEPVGRRPKGVKKADAKAE
ncbi:50S ribosomal protein L15 [Algisphaera agarilytica]|uniref:Large ribosomal subunit protein uL15 n=1 Tax=Algisphaera agarilytica TaxID=1385975 RepID=A0A7X0H866_9BACT|nr:50S ribosomal protein L15 [Algisphaera agarilytica]MBB6431044.1 large subunit ribosomal protein L15 [Algisphaera agarilytica]